jgi:dTMP kinase
MRGLFIVIDGVGGSGKSTQIELLKQKFPHAIFTKEPGGARRAEKIREVLKSGDDTAGALSDFFLFWAARAEHMTRLIEPALKKGKMVVCDRFDSSTFAMQVRGDKQKGLEKLFWQCREATLGKFTPDVYIMLDVPTDIAKIRRKRRLDRMGSQKYDDRFDERDNAYQSRIRAGYKEFAKLLGKKAVVLDARNDIIQTHQEIVSVLNTVPRH